MSYIYGHGRFRSASVGVLVSLVAGPWLIPSGVALAQCAPSVRDPSFENQRTTRLSVPWQAEGSAGVDRNRGFSYRGMNNAWARNTRGWNGIRQRVYLTAGYLHRLTAFSRTSSNVRAGYFGFRDLAQRPVAETKFEARARYTQLELSYRPEHSGNYYLFAGLWALGEDSWIQIDDVSMTAPCADNPGNPAPS